MCKEQGIQLIHIWEDEWEYKQDIIKNILFKHIKYNQLKRIYARKCNIKEICYKEAKEFFNKYHIQGFRKSKYYIGLYYNNELVACSSFNLKLSNFIKHKDKNKSELIRFCTNNSIVVGGLSKLIKYYMKTYNVKELISYTDRCKFNGNGYISSGFKVESISKPGYYYYTNNELIRHHRFKFNKQKLIQLGYDKNKSQSKIMNELGYYKIYDCGQIKLSYTLV